MKQAAPNTSKGFIEGLDLYQAASSSLAQGTYVTFKYATPAARFCGNGTEPKAVATCDGDASKLYTAQTYHDFALWAAAWNYKATGNSTVLLEAGSFLTAYLQTEAGLQWATEL